MEGNVYKLIELTGTSKTSVEDAVQTAIGKAAKSVRNMAWFQVSETRGAIKDNKIAEWQVTVKVGFKIEG
jgi:flavin-binding protein dodecin